MSRLRWAGDKGPKAFSCSIILFVFRANMQLLIGPTTPLPESVVVLNSTGLLVLVLLMLALVFLC